MYHMLNGKRVRKQICVILMTASLIAGSVVPAFASEGGTVETVSESETEYSAESGTQDSGDVSSEYITTENEEDLSDTEDKHSEENADETVEEVETDIVETEEDLSSKEDSQEEAAETETEDSGREDTGNEESVPQENTDHEEVVSEESSSEDFSEPETNSSLNISDTPDEGTTLPPVTKSIQESYGENDSEEMFAEYVDNLFEGENSSAAAKAKKNVGSMFTGASQMIYSQLLSGAQEIASGQRESTEFVFSAEDLGYGSDVSWSAADLGVEAIVVDDSISDSAADSTMEIIDEQLQLDDVICALLADCPYEFYWHDKSVGINRGTNIGAVYSDGEWRTYIAGDYIISLTVADEFAVSQYVADTTKTGAASLAVQNADSIVTENQGLTDIEKIYAYKNAICDAVSYNYDAAGGDTAYGNPWQLIWVFDGDDTTNVVCEGYAKAFQYLCDKSNFNCGDVCAYSVTGNMSDAADETDGEPHMWNIVTLDDGNNYLADVTNSDSGSIGQDGDLFIAPYTSGDVQDGYILRCNDTTDILYVYDENTTGLFTTADLMIAALPYGYTPAQDPLEITLQPQSVSASLEEQVSLHVEANLGEVSYQWQWSTNGTSWKNCTSSGCDTDTFSFRMKEVISGRFYRCIVTCGDETVYSDSAEITLDETTLEIISQPQDVSAYIEETVNLHVEANKSEVTYQWQWSANGTSWKNCTSSGCDTDTFSFRMKEVLSGRLYRCVVTSGNETVYSDSAEITLNDAVLEIISQPQDVVAAIGETVSLHVEANMSDVTYQWQWSANGTSWKNCTSSGYDTDTFSFRMQEVISGRHYRCAVTSGNETIYSDSAVITLNDTALEITCQPQDVTAYIGDTVNLHVEANMSDVTYQWQWSANGTSWKNCTSAGYNTDTFSFQMKEVLSGRIYRCAVTSGNETIYSDGAVITLDNLEITEQPQSVNACIDETVSLHVEANKSDVTYQWQWSTNGTSWKNCTSTGYNTDTFSFRMKEVLSGRYYRCAVSDSRNTVYSESALISLVLGAGACGDNVSWTLDEQGVLTISGTGEMWNFRNERGTKYDDDHDMSWEDELNEIREVVVEEGITVIGRCAFMGATNLTSVELPDSLRQLSYFAFYNCSSLQSIELPEGLNTIQQYSLNYTAISTLTIPSTVAYLDSQTCSYCPNLESVYIKKYEGASFIYGEGPFCDCPALEEIIVEDGHMSFEDIDGVLVDHVYSYLVQYPGGKTDTSYTIPEGLDVNANAFNGTQYLQHLDLSNLTVITQQAFRGCESLTSVTLSESLTSIPNSAFRECTALSSITLPDSVESLGGWCFAHCTSLTSITVPDGVDCPGSYAFSYCLSLTDITLPENMSGLGYGTFENCRGLTSINIPDAVTSIDAYTFSGCTALTSIVIPDNVTSIGDRALYGCTSLTSVTLPDSLESLGELALGTCTALTSITIPDGVINIGVSAFSGCERLKSVVIPDSVTTIGDKAFKYCYSLYGNHTGDVYYSGTSTQWDAINIGDENDCLLGANIHFESSGPEAVNE